MSVYHGVWDGFVLNLFSAGPCCRDLQKSRTNTDSLRTGERNREYVKRKSGKRTDGLLRRQRHFILEKLIGQTDKTAAIAAGYSVSTAENTKQKIWARAGVRAEFKRLRGIMIETICSCAARSEKRASGQ